MGFAVRLVLGFCKGRFKRESCFSSFGGLGFWQVWYHPAFTVGKQRSRGPFISASAGIEDSSRAAGNLMPSSLCTMCASSQFSGVDADVARFLMIEDRFIQHHDLGACKFPE